MDMPNWGAFAFGLVVGWVTYRTLRRSSTNGVSDIAAVVAAVGGGTITTLFPGTGEFAAYAVGLAVGFFGYVATAVVIARRTTGLSAVDEWLGVSPVPGAPAARRAAVPGMEPTPAGPRVPDFNP